MSFDGVGKSAVTEYSIIVLPMGIASGLIQTLSERLFNK
jgi:hypothetical protein